MEFLISYWYIIIGIIALLVVLGYAIYKFASLTWEEQLEKVKEWLLWAVVEAEKELGYDSGQVTVGYVYELFVDKFPWVSKLISAEKFNELVEDALEIVQALLRGSSELQEYVYKEHMN